MIQRGDIVVVVRCTCQCEDAITDYGLIFQVGNIDDDGSGLVCKGCGLELPGEPGIEHPKLGPGSYIPLSWVKKLDGLSPMERIDAVLEVYTSRVMTSADAIKITGWLHWGFDCAGRIRRG